MSEILPLVVNCQLAVSSTKDDVFLYLIGQFNLAKKRTHSLVLTLTDYYEAGGRTVFFCASKISPYFNKLYKQIIKKFKHKLTIYDFDLDDKLVNDIELIKLLLKTHYNKLVNGCIIVYPIHIKLDCFQKLHKFTTVCKSQSTELLMISITNEKKYETYGELCEFILTNPNGKEFYFWSKCCKSDDTELKNNVLDIKNDILTRAYSDSLRSSIDSSILYSPKVFSNNAIETIYYSEEFKDVTDILKHAHCDVSSLPSIFLFPHKLDKEFTLNIKSFYCLFNNIKMSAKQLDSSTHEQEISEFVYDKNSNSLFFSDFVRAQHADFDQKRFINAFIFSNTSINQTCTVSNSVILPGCNLCLSNSISNCIIGPDVCFDSEPKLDFSNLFITSDKFIVEKISEAGKTDVIELSPTIYAIKLTENEVANLNFSRKPAFLSKNSRFGEHIQDVVDFFFEEDSSSWNELQEENSEKEEQEDEKKNEKNEFEKEKSLNRPNAGSTAFSDFKHELYELIVESSHLPRKYLLMEAKNLRISFMLDHTDLIRGIVSIMIDEIFDKSSEEAALFIEQYGFEDMLEELIFNEKDISVFYEALEENCKQKDKLFITIITSFEYLLDDNELLYLFEPKFHSTKKAIAKYIEWKEKQQNI